jgi:hypothetical protein
MVQGRGRRKSLGYKSSICRAGESWSCSVVARVVAPLCERKNTLRGNKLSRKLSELVSGKLGVFGDLGL